MGCSALSGETIGMHPSHTPSIIHPLSHNIIYMYMYVCTLTKARIGVVEDKHIVYTCTYTQSYFSTHTHTHTHTDCWC